MNASIMLLAEGAGAAGVAALVGKRAGVRGRHAAVILSGGNIDRARLVSLLTDEASPQTAE